MIIPKPSMLLMHVYGPICYSFLQADYDVFNALDLMENSEFLEELKFGQGDGNLQYYLYNWRCPRMQPEKVCFHF